MDQKKLGALFDRIWQDYCQLNPNALKIYQLFLQQGEAVQNDHIAFRTFQDPRLGIQGLAQHFEKYGYVERGEYFFKEKKLYAKHYEHSESQLPKIFISELEINKMPENIQKILQRLMSSLPQNFVTDEAHMYAGRPWKVTTAEYAELAKVSEYASWVAAFGFRTNHFTVLVNSLKKMTNLEQVNSFIKQNGYTLNSSGGEIKGTPQECLEQSSTMAELIRVRFSDGELEIPGCYYEFARRYPMNNGQLYQGFIAQSADKIFESTDRKS